MVGSFLPVGIEAINAFCGTAAIDIELLARQRGLDDRRLENLLMRQKTVAMPNEDAVTFGANAAWPLVASLSEAERNRIELLITCSETGVDFGKSLSTYIHCNLGLQRNCRMFEIKQACYSGTAGFHAAAHFILSQTSPGAKALVIATDLSHFFAAEAGATLTQEWAYAELSGGAGAVAMLIGSSPRVFQLDVGASGYYGYEVMDTCRPVPDGEAGNSDLSMLSYLDCCEQSFLAYQHRVEGATYTDTFSHLAFHAPFVGMVKGAHRMMMRKSAPMKGPTDVNSDFRRRVSPGMEYCQQVGNIMGGSMYLSLASIIGNASLTGPSRIGCFSYGSGCCSEFFSGISGPDAAQYQKRFRISERLARRHPLSVAEYERLAREGGVRFGTRNLDLRGCVTPLPTDFRLLSGEPRLVLKRIHEYHREYDWLT